MAHMLKGFIEKAILTRTMQVAEYSLPSVGRMSDYEARFVALDDERVLYVARDVTSRKKLEHDLRLVAQNNQRQATELELLEQLRTLMNNQTELEVLFKTVNEAVANVLGYELIGISLIRDEYLEMQHSVGYTRLLPRFPIHQGVEGRVIRNARANLVQDVKQDPDYFEVEPNTKSEVCVPLFIKAQVAGVLIVESIKRILQETDLRILTRLGSYISLAMEQAQLYSEAKANEAQYRDLYTMSQQQAETLARRNNELVLFERIRDAIANELDINGLYQAVAENLVHSFGYHSVRVFEDTETVFRPVCQIGVLVSATDIPLNQGVAARVLRNDRADLVVDVLKDPDYVALESEMLSEMSLPLHCRGEVVAILSIETLRKDNIVLTEDDLRLVSTIAEQVDVAIERAYLYQETKANETKFRELYLVTQEQSELLSHRATELELLNQVRAIISSKLEPALLFKAVTEAVSHVLGYTFVGIALIKGEYLEIQYQLGYDMTVMPSILSLGQGVIGRVAQTGQRVLVPFVADDPDYVGPTNKSISEICVPLRIQDQVVGVLNVESTHAVLGETQLETLSQVAVYVGIALEQARLYQALQSSELRYRELIENASDIIYRTDSSGKFSYTNSVVTRLLGYKEQDILGKHYLELIRPDYQAQARAFYIKQVKEKTSTTYFEFPVLSIAGEEIWLGQNVQLIWEGEALIGMQAVARDVTQRKRMEEALLKQAEELSSANADLEQFAFIAAHDLQEPLRKIQAFGDRLNLKYKAVLDEQGQDYLERMRSSATRMRTLIDDLLSFARANKQQKRELISLETLIRSVLGDLQMPIEETQATIHVGGLPTLEVDPSQMRQLFQNLLSNALKFHRPQVAPVIDIYSYRLPSGDWEIRVSDNGIGFEEQYKDRIFAVFQRLHSREKYEGTGIGLAIARRIVEGHGGCIEVSSQLGKGTTFRVTLPPTSNVSLEKTLLKKPLLEKIESVVI